MVNCIGGRGCTHGYGCYFWHQYTRRMAFGDELLLGWPPKWFAKIDSSTFSEILRWISKWFAKNNSWFSYTHIPSFLHSIMWRCSELPAWRNLISRTSMFIHEIVKLVLSNIQSSWRQIVSEFITTSRIRHYWSWKRYYCKIKRIYEFISSVIHCSKSRYQHYKRNSTTIFTFGFK